MSDNIKLLEELVVEAVDRLRSLARERDALRKEVGVLHARLDVLQREGALGEGDPGELQAWEARRARALEVVREALSDLRGDGAAV